LCYDENDACVKDAIKSQQVHVAKSHMQQHLKWVIFSYNGREQIFCR